MRKKKNALGYTYLAPALISILLVTCLPIIYTVILSFTNYNMYHLTDYTFVGLENYLSLDQILSFVRCESVPDRISAIWYFCSRVMSVVFR